MKEYIDNYLKKLKQLEEDLYSLDDNTTDIEMSNKINAAIVSNIELQKKLDIVYDSL